MSPRPFLARLGLVSLEAGTLASLAIGIGTELDSANRTGLYSEVGTPTQECLHIAVGGVDLACFHRNNGGAYSFFKERIAVSDEDSFEPSTTIHARRNTNTGVRLDTFSNTPTATGGVQFYKARGNINSPAGVETNDTLGFVGAYGARDNGSFITTSRANIFFHAAETWTASAQGTYALHRVTPLGSAIPTVALGLYGNKVDVPLTTVSSSKTTGALTVAGGVGIGTNLWLGTHLTVDASVAPDLPPLAKGRIYFDSADNKFKVSENGGAYVNLVGSGGGGDIGGTIAATQVAFGSGTDTITGDNGFVYQANLLKVDADIVFGFDNVQSIVYLGDPDIDDTWRFTRAFDDFVFQRQESNIFETKFSIGPATVSIPLSTASTDTTTGALTVAGGISSAGGIHGGGTTVAGSGQYAGAFSIQGGIRGGFGLSVVANGTTSSPAMILTQGSTFVAPDGVSTYTALVMRHGINDSTAANHHTAFCGFSRPLGSPGARALVSGISGVTRADNTGASECRHHIVGVYALANQTAGSHDNSATGLRSEVTLLNFRANTVAAPLRACGTDTAVTITNSTAANGQLVFGIRSIGTWNITTANIVVPAQYGGYFESISNATGSNSAITNGYGIYAKATGAVTNWAGYFEGKIGVLADIELSSTSWQYFGAPATDGTWRVGRDGNNIVFQRRESGTYVTKQTITP
jgi:hypothetical protein